MFGQITCTRNWHGLWLRSTGIWTVSKIVFWGADTARVCDFSRNKTSVIDYWSNYWSDIPYKLVNIRTCAAFGSDSRISDKLMMLRVILTQTLEWGYIAAKDQNLGSLWCKIQLCLEYANIHWTATWSTSEKNQVWCSRWTKGWKVIVLYVTSSSDCGDELQKEADNFGNSTKK